MTRELAEILDDDKPFLTFLKQASQAEYLAQIETQAAAELAAWAETAPLPARIFQWLSPFWTPQLRTADSGQEESQVFTLAEGEIRVWYDWRPASAQNPAYVCVRWEANLTAPGEFWARFAAPETNAILAEVYLGDALQGEETFTSADLGFNPATQRWTIAIAFVDRQA